MSTAQVVLGNFMNGQQPGRLAAPGGGERARVRRNLFGPVDHQQTRRLLQRELNRISRQDNQRWNFDFSKETPLQGRYDWSAVGEHDEVHDTYALRGLPFCAQHGRNEETTTSQGPAAVPTDPAAPQEEEVPVPVQVQNEVAPSTSRQSTIPEFMRQRKRLAANKKTDTDESSKKPKTTHRTTTS